jgi:hypothetical protein
MKKATELEEAMSPPSGPPVLIKPTHELFGEILLRRESRLRRRNSSKSHCNDNRTVRVRYSAPPVRPHKQVINPQH